MGSRFLRVADAIVVDVRRTKPTAFSQGVLKISLTIACSRQDAASIADATFVKFTNAIVHVVTHPVAVGIGRTISIADPEGIVCADTVVLIVADVILIDIRTRDGTSQGHPVDGKGIEFDLSTGDLELHGPGEGHRRHCDGVQSVFKGEGVAGEPVAVGHRLHDAVLGSICRKQGHVDVQDLFSTAVCAVGGGDRHGVGPCRIGAIREEQAIRHRCATGLGFSTLQSSAIDRQRVELHVTTVELQFDRAIKRHRRHGDGVEAQDQSLCTARVPVAVGHGLHHPVLGPRWKRRGC